VAKISDRVVVLYMGEVAEIGPARELFTAPRHPYTELLISAIPRPDPTHRMTGAIEVSEPPSRLQHWTGCPFHNRCPRATEICDTTPPSLHEVAPERFVACHHA
jgi:oligopeptide/dipeptide ABC transporter ATP-binding protein